MNKAFMQSEFEVFKEIAQSYTREVSGELKGSFESGEIKQNGTETKQDWMNTSNHATWINYGERDDPRTGKTLKLKSPPDYFMERGENYAAAHREQRYQKKLSEKFMQ